MTQIQKYCYYAYGFYYFFYKESLFEEDFIKHNYGPYNVSLYLEMKDLKQIDSVKLDFCKKD